MNAPAPTSLRQQLNDYCAKRAGISLEDALGDFDCPDSTPPVAEQELESALLDILDDHHDQDDAAQVRAVLGLDDNDGTEF